MAVFYRILLFSNVILAAELCLHIIFGFLRLDTDNFEMIVFVFSLLLQVLVRLIEHSFLIH